MPAGCAAYTGARCQRAAIKDPALPGDHCLSYFFSAEFMIRIVNFQIIGAYLYREMQMAAVYGASFMFAVVPFQSMCFNVYVLRISNPIH